MHPDPMDDATVDLAAGDARGSHAEGLRLVQALDEFEAARARGNPPDRSEFLRRFADVADELEECLEGLERLEGAGAWFQGDASPPPVQLGDYRIIRELGRGGMGIVYEAEQASLGRRVALKLLPSTSAMDPRHVQRFQVEVQAAGHLRHPHIVPIYAVGCDSGLHYYSMQYVSGRPLSAWVDELRANRGGESGSLASPSWVGPGRREAAPAPRSSRPGAAFHRTVARLGMQAAEALDHAHGLGVIHRDVKPGNLLIDEDGELWVADFGLARLHGASGLTGTGDLVGTLRYMSPEQVEAGGVVDARTDLYSLGVTLYELLAFEPAFSGGDVAALVRRIVDEDPAPLSRWAPSVPRDLETIVLKAMAKDPAGRYASARELADDLKRFLDDKPILGRRPTWTERTLKWMRRHRPIAAALAGLLVLATVCLAISTLVIWGAMWRIRSEADARLRQLDRAQLNLDVAHRALELYLDSAESWIPRGSGDEQGPLGNALRYYEQIAAENDAEPSVAARTTDAYVRIGDIRSTLGRPGEAEYAYRRAMELILRRIGTGGPSSADAFTLAVALRKYAELLRRHALFGPGEWAVDQSVQYLRRIGADDAPAKFALAQSLNLKSNIEGDTVRFDRALADVEEALRLLTQLRDRPGVGPPSSIDLGNELTAAYTGKGMWLQLSHRPKEAEDAYRTALRLVEEFAIAAAGQPMGRESLARCHARLGELLWESGRPEDAVVAMEQGVSAFKRLADDFPRVPRYRSDLARAYEILGRLYWTLGRHEKSEAARMSAIEIDPRREAFEQRRANNIAWYLVTTPDVASRNPAKAVELAELVVANDADDWACWNTLGVARYRNGDWERAKAAFDRALELNGRVEAFDGFGLAMTLWRLGRRDEAREWFRRSEEHRRLDEPDDLELLRFSGEARALIGETPGSQAAPPPASLPEVLAASPWFGPGLEPGEARLAPMATIPAE